MLVEKSQMKHNPNHKWRYKMPNVTISLDEDLLRAGRQYAKRHNTSVNALTRKLLEQAVRPQSEDWLDECFNRMDQAGVNSQGKHWKREDLYDGQVIRSVRIENPLKTSE